MAISFWRAVAREEKIRDVGAGNQQYHADGDERDRGQGDGARFGSNVASFFGSRFIGGDRRISSPDRRLGAVAAKKTLRTA